jgi:hypothetical protein
VGAKPLCCAVVLARRPGAVAVGWAWGLMAVGGLLAVLGLAVSPDVDVDRGGRLREGCMVFSWDGAGRRSGGDKGLRPKRYCSVRRAFSRKLGCPWCRGGWVAL